MNVNLDDINQYELFHSFSFSNVYTYGSRDQEHREEIRSHALEQYPSQKREYKWWAFRIEVESDRSQRSFDIDNVSKLILDSFSSSQIERDNLTYKGLALYPDDTIEYVRVVELYGKISNKKQTTVKIYGRR